MKHLSNVGGPIRPVLVETLEARQLLSATTAVKIASSLHSPLFGQSFTIVATVTSPKAKVTKGFVELFVNKIYTGFREQVNKKGVATFSVGAGDALDVGTAALSAHYVVNSVFAASTSKHINVQVELPSNIVTASDGLRTAVLTKGKGARVAKGDIVTFKNTVFNSNGREVAETAAFKPPIETFIVGEHPLKTVAGLNQALLGMQVGEVLDVFIPSTLAYNNGLDYFAVVQLVSFKS